MEEFTKMICEDAVKYFFGVMNDDFYYKITNNIFELTYEEAIKYAKKSSYYINVIKLRKMAV